MTKKDLSYISIVVSFCITLFCGIVLLSTTLHAFNYLLGTAYYKQPSIPKPAKGVPFVDPVFGTTITRVSDVSDGIGYIDRIYNPYSTVTVANCDDTYIFAKTSSPSGDYIIYQGPNNSSPYTYVQIIKPISVCSSPVGEDVDQTPHWDKSNPDKLYILKGKYTQITIDGPKLYSYSVSTGKLALIHNFTNEPGINKFFTGANSVPVAGGYGHYIDWQEYNDHEKNQRYWAFAIYNYNNNGAQLNAALIYDMQTNSVVSWTEDPNKICINTNKGLCEMSPGGQYLIANSIDLSHVNIMDRSFNVIWRNVLVAGHCDTGIDAEGRDILWGESFDGGDWITMFDLADGTLYGIAPRVCNTTPGAYQCATVHYSGHNFSKPGWGLVSVDDSVGVWGDRQLFMLELDRRKAYWRIPWMGSKQNINPSSANRIWRLCQTHSSGTTYAEQSQATISSSGLYVYYHARWEVSSSNIDVYQVTLPPTWYQDLKGNIQPDITPPAKPTGLKILK